MRLALVIPSIREVNLSYLQPALEDFEALIIVDDSDGEVQVNHPKARVFDYSAQENYMGAAYKLVPHKSKACAMFGTYYAYKEGYDAVVVLDDDCRADGEFYATYSSLGENRVLESVIPRDSGWFDPIPLPDVWARGFPFWLKTEPKFKLSSLTNPLSRRVTAILGLWDGVLDINAIDKIAHRNEEQKLPESSLLWGLGHFPMSGMNIGLAREVIPAYPWFPKLKLLEGFTLNRHEDIWAGYILQKIAQKLYLGLAFGRPIVTHLKAGNLEAELLAEHCEQQLARWFYEAVDSASLTESSVIGLVSQIGEAVLVRGLRFKERGLALPGRCLEAFGKYMIDWMEVFGRV